MSPKPYTPAFRIPREARLERLRAKNLCHVYRTDRRTGQRKCIRCEVPYGDPHRAPCVPDPHIP